MGNMGKTKKLVFVTVTSRWATILTNSHLPVHWSHRLSLLHRHGLGGVCVCWGSPSDGGRLGYVTPPFCLPVLSFLHLSPHPPFAHRGLQRLGLTVTSQSFNKLLLPSWQTAVCARPRGRDTAVRLPWGGRG